MWSFLHGSRRDEIEHIEAVPARCADMLANAEADVALVPVIEYQRIPNLVLIPDVCVGSRKAVRSVVLATKKKDLKNLRRIALDESSRTSVALLKIIFREFLAYEPEWHISVPDIERMLSEDDAALIIGDPGMTFPRENLNVFDLAKLWREYTGSGFVFAMWMLRPESPAAAKRIDFRAACEEGIERIEEIVEVYQPLLKLSRQDLFEYLTQNISFFLDDEMRSGLELYFELAYKHGLIPTLKSLKTLDA